LAENPEGRAPQGYFVVLHLLLELRNEFDSNIMKIFSARRLIKKVLRKFRLIDQSNSQGKNVRIRKDVEIISIQPNLEFEVYWKVLSIGRGPAVILKANGKEVMKFDAFGKNKGHYHIAPCYNLRIFFPEETAQQQIQRTSLELQKNAQKYLEIQSDSRIKQIRIDDDKLSNATQKVVERMTYFLQEVPELESLR